MHRTYTLFLAALTAMAALVEARAAGRAEHVVLVVWDGLRPDYVREQYTPTLTGLARRGVFFTRHHSTFPTSTEVNGVALATGMSPKRSGVFANTQYRPELGWLGTYGTENLDAIRRGDLVWDGHYLQAATLAETLQRAGIPTITAGAKAVVLLHDRSMQKDLPAQKESVTLFRGRTLPRAALQALTNNAAVGPFPNDEVKPDSIQGKVLRGMRIGRDKVSTWLTGTSKVPSLARRIDDWTTRAVAHGLWAQGVPKYTVLWLSEPDSSQHESGVGSENALAALEHCDRNLALVIQALKERELLERTDLLVVSDHGFSTVDRGVEVVKPLRRAGFIADKQFDNPERGDVLVVQLGGSIAFYVFERDEPTIRRLVAFLQECDFTGVLFSAVPVEGTFPLAVARLDSPHGAPDVLVSLRWNGDRNVWSAPGQVAAGEGKRGRGTHASLSPYDLHNTLIAAGPDFKPGYASELPSGNADLAPTILEILGILQPSPMDGRVLAEAMVGDRGPVQRAEAETLEAQRDLGFGLWHQYLKSSRVGSAVYLEEGNGQVRAK